eukprot:UN27805
MDQTHENVVRDLRKRIEGLQSTICEKDRTIMQKEGAVKRSLSEINSERRRVGELEEDIRHRDAEKKKNNKQLQLHLKMIADLKADFKKEEQRLVEAQNELQQSKSARQ